MDRQGAATLVELHERLMVAREGLRLQSRRLTELLQACRLTQLRTATPLDDRSAPRLFASDVVRLGPVEILVPRQAIRHNAVIHRLTPTEWQLLTFLLAHPYEVLSRMQLAAGAWGAGFAERNSEVEVYISRLRRKLGPAGCLLETVRRQGYRLSLETLPADPPVSPLTEMASG